MQHNVIVFQQRTLALHALPRTERGVGDGLLQVEYSSINTDTERQLGDAAIAAFPSKAYALALVFCRGFLGPVF
jgi:hypothetical protein